jgi:hypothetical protein
MLRCLDYREPTRVAILAGRSKRPLSTDTFQLVQDTVCLVPVGALSFLTGLRVFRQSAWASLHREFPSLFLEHAAA